MNLDNSQVTIEGQTLVVGCNRLSYCSHYTPTCERSFFISLVTGSREPTDKGKSKSGSHFFVCLFVGEHLFNLRHKTMKKQYAKPSMEATVLEMKYVILDGSPGGTGEDIPWGAPGKNPFQPSF